MVERLLIDLGFFVVLYQSYMPPAFQSIGAVISICALHSLIDTLTAEPHCRLNQHAVSIMGKLKSPAKGLKRHSSSKVCILTPLFSNRDYFLFNLSSLFSSNLNLQTSTNLNVIIRHIVGGRSNREVGKG